MKWWQALFPDQAPSQKYLRGMAGSFARRVKAFSQKHAIPIQYCEIGDKTKYARAERARPKDANFQGLFLILVARAPAPVWRIKHSRRGKLLIRRSKNWPLVNHYHFHILHKQWGHITITQQVIIQFLAAVQAAHLSFLPAQQLDSLAMPTYRGQQRLAAVDIQKPRMRAVAQAVIALAPQPEGFTAEQLAARVRTHQGRTMAKYNARKAAYDLRKLRGKALVARLAHTRRYRVRRPGIRTLAALVILREKVLKPVLAGVCRPKRGRSPKDIHPLDLHYQALQRQMLSTLQYLKLAA